MLTTVLFMEDERNNCLSSVSSRESFSFQTRFKSFPLDGAKYLFVKGADLFVSINYLVTDQMVTESVETERSTEVSLMMASRLVLRVSSG